MSTSNKILIFLVIIITLGCLQHSLKKFAERNDAQYRARIADAYDRGFMDGMHSTINNIKFDTNKGKFSVELTNVLAGMDEQKVLQTRHGITNE